MGTVVLGGDYYELLGVDRNATAVEIKSAYRLRAKVMHPDGGGTADSFQQLREAYETLNDPARRASYDRTGTGSAQPRRPAPAAKARSRPAPRPRPRAASRWRDFGQEADFVPAAPKVNLETVTWWPAVNTAERVRYVPVTGPQQGPVLAAVGGWLLVLVVLLAAGLSPLPLVILLVLLLAAAVPVSWLVRQHLAAGAQDRAFVAEFGLRTVYGRPGADTDQVGEQLTATLLTQYLTRLPGVRIFHGLAWPGSVFADVDHAVLCGRRLVLIESKSWLPGHYNADESGTLWRNGHPFRGGAIRLPEGISAYRELLPGLEIRGALLIYPSRAGEITTGTPPEVPAPPMSPARFVREIGEWLAAEPATVDRGAFRTVLAQVVS